MNRGAVVLLVMATAAVLFGKPVYAGWATVIALAAAWILDPRAVRAGLRFGVILAIVFAASITAAVVAWSAGPEKGLVNGGMVLLRLLVLSAAAAVLVRSVDAERVLRAAERAGFTRLGLVLGMSLNSLPRIVEAIGEVWAAFKVRTRTPTDGVRRIPALGEVLLAHTARIAEEAAAAASLRGHSSLTRPGAGLRSPVRTVVLTGPSDGGKTASALRLMELCSDRDIPVAGFVQLGEIEEGGKVGFRVRDVVSGEEAPLARRAAGGDGDFNTRFRFFDEGFALGRTALERAISGGIVVVDELGPVELRGEGHMPAVVRAMQVPGLAAAVVVVRRSLVPSLLATLEATDAVVVDVGDYGETASDEILEALELHSEFRIPNSEFDP
jgi:nucleoside-triphosphatase